MLTTETGINPETGKRFVVFRGSPDEIDNASRAIRSHTRETSHTTCDDVPSILQKAKIRTRGPICSPPATAPVGQHRRAPGAQGSRRRGSSRTSSGSSPPSGDSDPDESDPASRREYCCVTCGEEKFSKQSKNQRNCAACRQRQKRQRDREATKAKKPESVESVLAEIDALVAKRKLAWEEHQAASANLDAALDKLWEAKRRAEIARGYALDHSDVRAVTMVGGHPKPRATKPWKRDRRRKPTTALAHRQAGAHMAEVAA